MIRRDGHATDLAMERFELGELPSAAAAEFERHLRDCLPCRRRLEEVRTSTPLAPPGRTARGSNRRRGALSVAAGLVAAAAAFMLVSNRGDRARPSAAAARPDRMRAKGTGFRVELYAHDGAGARRVRSGDRVRAGERLGFRAAANADGYLLIVGRDQRGSVYECYPQRAQGAAAPLPAGPAAALDAAVRLDAVPGSESIYSVFCPHPFSRRDLLPAGSGTPVLPPGCARLVHVLRKELP